MVDMGRTSCHKEHSRTIHGNPGWDVGPSSLASSPERLSAGTRKLGEERAGCVQPGRGGETHTRLTCSVSQGKGGSSPGWDVADKALWEQEALAEVRKGTGRRLGEGGGGISKCQCPEETDTPGTLFPTVFCLFLTPNPPSLISDYIFLLLVVLRRPQHRFPPNFLYHEVT